jgi:hypothetical protein
MLKSLGISTKLWSKQATEGRVFTFSEFSEVTMALASQEFAQMRIVFHATKLKVGYPISWGIYF